MIIEKKKNLFEYNTYKINIIARYFIEIDIIDICEVFKYIEKKNIKKFFIIGSGANTIFKNNFYNGLVIKIKKNNLEWECFSKVKVSAGLEWDSLLSVLQKKGEYSNSEIFFNIQSLSLIPGTVGAGTFGNIGAFGTEIKKYISSVEYFNIEEKKVLKKNFEDLDFSYRNSFFKKNNGKNVILNVNFDFSEEFKKKVEKFYKDEEYFSLEYFAKKHNLGEMKKIEIRKNIIKIRKSIYPDIEKFPNVGSTFKNAEIVKKKFEKILEKYPEIPNWELKNEKVKIPTAYIFDKVLKLNGKIFGNIKIDEKRPLFFVNTGGANGEEFFNLCQKIKKNVFEIMGIKIEEEVNYVD